MMFPTKFIYFCFLICCLLCSLTASPCPCQDSSLCNVVKITGNNEVFIFSVEKSKQSWLKYDWNKVTSIVTFGYMDTRLMCLAHKHNARVIHLVNYPVKQLLNVTHSNQWIKDQIKEVQKYHYDGVNFDIEDPLELTREDLRNALTQLVNRTSIMLKSINKNYQVTFDVPWNPHCVDDRCYDVTALSTVTDFLFVMSYDQRSQIGGPCVAGPNSHYTLAKSGIQEYLKMLIPSQKLVLGVPWYGYHYPCVALSENNVCKIKMVPFRGMNCSDAAGKQLRFSDIVEIYLKKSLTGRQWDTASKTPYFTYQENHNSSYQVWYDDAESLGLKYKLVQDLNLHGVGMWNVDCVDYDNSTMSTKLRNLMWNALPSYN
ncbi:di-N-acetylchitobiase [Octopus bimaculoides]|uniref:Di-N-acetylchitobiase n=1 Tax=Octopus bimaculoides TaxID=37653 RepID=A0A0L8G0Z7_OCTBM|nr:di-N-acetylchitobiase [Octopus bimaculoides]|eukprot:XP_014785201.1 PREDICTED: di-N-acetylchitobiase-like [Octopus bimaculoides]